MSVEECKECSGTGAKDGGPCSSCQGNGVLGVDISPVDPSSISAVTEIPAPKLKLIPSYYPERWIKTMSERTLEEWREDLERKKSGLKIEMDKLDGGLLQIEVEIDRRASLKR